MAIIIEKPKQNINKKPIGIKLPLNDDSDIGYFESTYITFDAVKENIRNLLMTSKGERLFQPDMGMGLENLLFENIDDDMTALIDDTIKTSLGTWLPYVGIQNIDINVESDDNSTTNRININIKFFI